MNQIIVRIATASDAELIAELSRTTFYEAFIADNRKEDMDDFMNHTFTKEALIKEVGSAGNIFLLAYDEGKAVGYARLREGTVPALNNSNAIEVARIYAATGQVGKGVGKALMQKSLDVAEQQGKDVIWLGVWEHNPRAIHFYQKFGFEKFDEHDFVLGKDVQKDWLMKRNVIK